jgi:cytochrome b561/polyisoprenoid-binding protein YceI
VKPNEQRYTAVAIILHWAIAAAILSNLFIGWWMQYAIGEVAIQARAIAAFQLHKSIGLTVLLLSALRLLWRLTHRPPSLPTGMPRWERFAARAAHGALYILMGLVPLTGWIYVSSQWADGKPLNVPTLWFGLLHIPHLFDAHAMTGAARTAVSVGSKAAHDYLAWSLAGLLVLHVGAALKHHFFNRDAVLIQMLPALRPAESPVPRPHAPTRRAVLRLGAGLIFVALAALGYVLWRGPVTSAAGVGPDGTLTSVTGSWIVDPSSRISFSGTHAGTDFHMKFTRWSSDIRYNPAAPESSRITASIETGSAADGVPLHEQTLPQAEWFNVAKYPKAEFKATRVSGDGVIDGTLTIKDRPLRVAGLKASVDKGVLHITGTLDIARKDADLGQESDPGGDYVSLTIRVDVNVTARAPPLQPD